MTPALYAELVQRVELREADDDLISSGAMQTTYTVKATVWGRVKPLSMANNIGRFMRDSQTDNIPTHIIRLRVNQELGVTRSGLQGNMYLYVADDDDTGRSFRILSPVDKDDRGNVLDVLVREMGVQYGADGLT